MTNPHIFRLALNRCRYILKYSIISMFIYYQKMMMEKVEHYLVIMFLNKFLLFLVTQPKTL